MKLSIFELYNRSAYLHALAFSEDFSVNLRRCVEGLDEKGSRGVRGLALADPVDGTHL